MNKDRLAETEGGQRGRRSDEGKVGGDIAGQNRTKAREREEFYHERMN